MPIGGDQQGQRERETPSEAARQRAATELIARHEGTLRRTARRYSLCAADADDALQRALEIVLTKAPTDDPGELIRWTQTVTKHEALAVRRHRERILAPASAKNSEVDDDWVASIASEAAGPAERAERSETIARSREALQALKPQELRALTLLAEGYSYAEISSRTGWTATKVNRCLAEGRERFRKLIVRTEDGRRCEEMRPLLSAFCDGESQQVDTVAVREHLRACAGCRAALRAYRAAPGAAAALAPTLPLGRSLLDRLHDTLAGLAPSRGAASEVAISQLATGGGSRGAGMAALAKVLTICMGTAGGAAACVATGVVPAPLDLPQKRVAAPTIERHSKQLIETSWNQAEGVDYAPEETAQPPVSKPSPSPAPAPEETKAPEPSAEPQAAPVASAGAVEYAPEPVTAPSAAPTAAPSSAPTEAAGEFGP